MIELRNVTKEYSKGNAALNGVSVKIERGEFVFIVGDSGSGKVNSDPPYYERIKPDGRDDHRKRAEPQPNEASSNRYTYRRAWSSLSGFQAPEGQKYL